MRDQRDSRVVVSVIVPCFNEEATLERCIRRLLAIEDTVIRLEVVIVNDASTDRSLEVARVLAQQYPQLVVLNHTANQGKGAALNTGLQKASGDFIAIQDADLEYDPADLRKLLDPLLEDRADVVFGSRFLSAGAHRVLYFWHSVGNAFLTFLSNMFTDLNLTDMETCYKVFRATLIKQVTLREQRFGIEPELVAKIAHLRPRVYEMGISYHGRTYEEGKKIGVRDGLRALYCIFHYNAPHAPAPMQFIIYLAIGGTAALFNLVMFLIMRQVNIPLNVAILAAFFLAAALNYGLCIALLFRHRARWSSPLEAIIYVVVVTLVAVIDLTMTRVLLTVDFAPASAKLSATVVGLIFNFAGRKYLVFPERPSGPWIPIARND